MVALTDLERVSTAPVAVASASPLAAALVIWTAKLRTGRVAGNRANSSRTFNVAALIDLVVAEDLVASIAPGVADSAVAASGVVDLAVFAAAADSGADGEN
jgi:hypothetical protein